MAALKLITFDLDNTLWPVDEVIRRAERRCAEWIAEKHPDAAAWMGRDTMMRIRNQLLHDKPGYIHNLTALRRDALAHGFREAGYCTNEAALLADQGFRVFHDARNEVVFFPGALETLELLAGSYQLGALTNGNADLKKIGIHELFDFHHSAESIGRRKPEPAIFQAALQSAGVRPEQAVHVGDHPEEDIHGARQQGFHAIWANLLDQSWPAHLDNHPHRIHNLHELSDLLAMLDD
jgi:FMN hydrolase / 5-amino-6-(5-phospho-D-ribitylamino)uracil phosphatase